MEDTIKVSCLYRLIDEVRCAMYSASTDSGHYVCDAVGRVLSVWDDRMLAEQEAAVEMRRQRFAHWFRE